MNWVQLLLSFGPTVVLCILFLIKGVSFKKIINGFFYGIISFVITTFLEGALHAIIPPKIVALGLSFVMAIFVAGIPEELAKILSIKFARGKSKNDIFVYSMLVAFTFAALENYIYFNSGGTTIGIRRLLMPGHITFQLVMAFFLVQALKGKGKVLYNLLAFVLPVILHALFDAYIDFHIVVYIVGVLIYLLVIVKTLMLKKEDTKTKINLFILKLILIVLILPIFLHAMILKSVTESEIDNNVSLKVISTYSYSVTKFNHFCVKTEITNDREETYKINSLNFHLIPKDGSDLATLSSISEYEVEPNTKKNIDFCFFDDDKKEYEYMRYKPLFTQGEEIMFDLK